MEYMVQPLHFHFYSAGPGTEYITISGRLAVIAMKEGNTRLESISTESFQSEDSCKIPICGFFLLEENLFPCLTKHDDKDGQAFTGLIKDRNFENVLCNTLKIES